MLVAVHGEKSKSWQIGTENDRQKEKASIMVHIITLKGVVQSELIYLIL